MKLCNRSRMTSCNDQMRQLLSHEFQVIKVWQCTFGIWKKRRRCMEEPCATGLHAWMPRRQKTFFRRFFSKCAPTSNNFPFYIENKFITLLQHSSSPLLLHITKFSQSLKNRSMLFFIYSAATLFMARATAQRWEMILRIMPSGGQKFKFSSFFPNAAE